jgi:hypothetical protein
VVKAESSFDQKWVPPQHTAKSIGIDPQRYMGAESLWGTIGDETKPSTRTVLRQRQMQRAIALVGEGGSPHSQLSLVLAVERSFFKRLLLGSVRLSMPPSTRFLLNLSGFELIPESWYRVVN